MKKHITLLTFNLLLSLSVMAQTYSLNVTNLIHPAPTKGGGVIGFQIAPVGFNFSSAVTASSFETLISSPGNFYNYFQTPNLRYISPTQVLLTYQVKCYMPFFGVITFHDPSATPTISANQNFRYNSLQFEYSFTGASYYCLGVPQTSPILQITNGGESPYSVVFHQDTIKNISQSQLVNLPGLPDGSSLTIIDSLGCINSDLNTPANEIVGLTAQGEEITPSDVSCDGSGIRYFNATVGGTLKYQWYDKDTIAIPGQDSAKIKGVCSGRYYVIATLPGSSVTPTCSTMSFVDIPFNSVTGTSDQTANKYINAFVLDDQLYILSPQENVVLTIYDTKGIEHYQQLISVSGTVPVKVNINTLPTGLYFYKIDSNGGVKTGKFSR